MAAPLAIEVVDVSKRFLIDQEHTRSLKERIVRRKKRTAREFWALRNVSVQVPKGSFFGLIGHNGSGKSTLLRIMGGIHRPTSGDVMTNGRISALLELGAGFHPDLTGRENIFLSGAMLGLSRADMERNIDSIIDFSGIDEFVDAPVKIYSSGMHVRLGFAIAVHVDPEILIVDEVLAVGDEDFQRRCLDHIYALRRQGTTIVLVSHAIAQMETLCDELAWLDHGELREVGEPTAVASTYLASVNEIENQRLAQAASGPDAAADAGSRTGSGELRVRDITLLDGEGARCEAATSGDPLTIRLHFHAGAAIDEPVFGLAVHHESGTHLAGPNQKLQGVANGSIATGDGYVDFTLDRVALLPGNYYLTTGIYSTNLLHCFDSWDRSHGLTVQPGSSPERHGLVDLQGTWSTARPARRADT